MNALLEVLYGRDSSYDTYKFDLVICCKIQLIFLRRDFCLGILNLFSHVIKAGSELRRSFQVISFQISHKTRADRISVEFLKENCLGN